MTRAAPLPGVVILITTPPLHLPTLLLASHIKHPLKESYPALITEQWTAHLAQIGIEAAAASSEPVVWLKGVPYFSRASQADEDASDTDEEDSQDDQEEAEEEDSDAQPGDDQEDEDGNVWRGLKKDMKSERTAKAMIPANARGTAVANLTIGQVTYLAPIPLGTDPLLPLSFLYHLHSVLLMYFPATSSSSTLAASPNAPTPIPASVLSSNFDLVYQLLQEMLDDGRPLTVEYNSLKGIVRGRAWWEDIMARMGSLSSSNPAPLPEISPLAWRPAQVRYSRNEVYVDIVESLNGVIDRKGEPLGGLSLTVSITCRTKLSGTPDMALSLHPSPTAHPTAIVGPSLHPCVRTRRWTREGILSFVPPDGAFELAQFSIPFSSSARSGKSLAASASSSTDATGWAKDVPLIVKAKRSPVKESKGREWTFEITLSAKSGRSGPTCSEGVEVSFHVSPRAGSEADASLGSPNVDARASVSNRAALSGGPGGASSYTGLGADDPGVWRFDAREGLVRWTIPRLGSSHSSSLASSSSSAAGPSAGAGPSEVTLKGTVTAASSASSSSSSSPSTLSKSSALLVAFSLPLGQPSLSGVRVASLHITGVDYKPFKGVRGATRGRIEWRW